jgi:hypothetical protein
MILSLKDPKHSTKILLNLINTFNKVTGLHCINYCINNEQAEKETRKAIPSTSINKKLNIWEKT